MNIFFRALNINYKNQKNKFEFYESIFIFLDLIINSKSINNAYVDFINAIIKLILNDDKNILKQFMKSDNKNKNKIFKRIIFNIRNILIKHLHMDIPDNEINNLNLEYLNSLIILLESFGEYNNKFLLQFIFENETQDQEVEEKNLFDNLIDFYDKLLYDLYKINDSLDYNQEAKNKLILLHSLTNCINEYIELANNNYQITNDDITIDEICDEELNDDIYFEYYYKDNYVSGDEGNNIFLFFDKKIENIKINNNTEINNKINLKYDLFALENHLLINIHLLKNLQHKKLNIKNKFDNILKKFNMIKSDDNKIKVNFYETLYLIDICFETLLKLENITLKYNNNLSIDNYKINISDKINYDLINYNEDNEDKQLNIENNENDNDILNIKNDVLYLLEKYKNNGLIIKDENKNIKKELLLLIYLNYQKIFYFINSNLYEFKEFEYFLAINDIDDNIRKIKDFFDYLFNDK